MRRSTAVDCRTPSNRTVAYGRVPHRRRLMRSFAPSTAQSYYRQNIREWNSGAIDHSGEGQCASASQCISQAHCHCRGAPRSANSANTTNKSNERQMTTRSCSNAAYVPRTFSTPHASPSFRYISHRREAPRSAYCTVMLPALAQGGVIRRVGEERKQACSHDEMPTRIH